MSILKEFDKAMAEIGTEKYGTENNTNTYEAYMDKASWNNFIAEMNEKYKNHKVQFEKGSGKELEWNGHKPPKMASYASSSRMLYLHSRDVKNFVFEKKMATTVGGIANMDGYLKLENKQIFVEAKCREPYSKSKQHIKNVYKEIYCYLSDAMPDIFTCDIAELAERDEMNVNFFCKKNEVIYFDIKQMICHLLAIATRMIKNRSTEKVDFLYFLYNPTELNIPKSEKDKIIRIYNDTCYAAKNYDFEKMYGFVVDYLIDTNKFSVDGELREKFKSAFTFKLCDQNNYNELLK